MVGKLQLKQAILKSVIHNRNGMNACRKINLQSDRLVIAVVIEFVAISRLRLIRSRLDSAVKTVPIN